MDIVLDLLIDSNRKTCAFFIPSIIIKWFCLFAIERCTWLKCCVNTMNLQRMSEFQILSCVKELMLLLLDCDEQQKFTCHIFSKRACQDY